MRISISESLANRDNNLNALRLLAALLVLFSHCYPLSGNVKLEPIAHLTGNITDGGMMAVVAFFFLSGYLISASWTSTGNFPAFMAKRSLRIFPGLAVAVLFTAFLLGPLMTTLDIGQYFHTGKAWLYIRDNTNVLSQKHNTLPGVFEINPLPYAVNGSLWTLKAEFLAYIMIGIIGATCLLPAERKIFRCTIFAGVLLFVSARLVNMSNAELEALLPFHLAAAEYRLLAAFMIGTATFVMRHWLIRSWWVFAGLIAATWLAWGTMPFGILLYLMFCYFLLLLATSPIHVLGKSIRTHDYSYGVYIYAFPVQQTIVAFDPGIGPLTLFLISLPVIMAFAIASWHYVEKPSLGLKNALLGRISKRTQT